GATFAWSSQESLRSEVLSWYVDYFQPHAIQRLTRLAAEAARRPTTTTLCADAFSYRLTVGTIETGYVDCPTDTAPPPATQALVELLLRATG
ncbi:hypothetical protein EAD98_20700, partial [Micromonospora sp. CV4]